MGIAVSRMPRPRATPSTRPTGSSPGCVVAGPRPGSGWTTWSTAAKTSSLHLAVLIGLYRFETVERGPLLLIPLGYCVVAAVLFFGTMLNEALAGARTAR